MDITEEIKSLLKSDLLHIWRYGFVETDDDELLWESSNIFFELDNRFLKLSEISGVGNLFTKDEWIDRVYTFAHKCDLTEKWIMNN